jgi:hyperosmotically inducible protein
MRGIDNHVRHVALVLALAGAPGLLSAQAQPAAPDNTKQNKANGPMAGNQKEDQADRAISQKIRKAILAEKSLSTYAHNVKIITVHGSVTLKGPVRSDEEKAAIEAKAAGVAGAGNVTSELAVASKKEDKK